MKILILLSMYYLIRSIWMDSYFMYIESNLDNSSESCNLWVEQFQYCSYWQYFIAYFYLCDLRPWHYLCIVLCTYTSFCYLRHMHELTPSFLRPNVIFCAVADVVVVILGSIKPLSLLLCIYFIIRLVILKETRLFSLMTLVGQASKCCF